MDKESLIRNIDVSLRGLNGGMGQYRLIRRGLEKMAMDELMEFNQLVLSIQSTQMARAKKARFQYPYRRG